LNFSTAAFTIGGRWRFDSVEIRGCG